MSEPALDLPVSSPSNSAVGANRNGGDAAVAALVDAGVDVVFGIPASHVIEIYDALGRESRIRTVVGRNEQGCAYMADGFARRRRSAGVAVVTGGPGLGNAATGLQTAYADSSPLVVIASDLGQSQRSRVPLGIPHETFNAGALATSTGATLHRAETPDEVGEQVVGAVREAERGRHRPSVCLLARPSLEGPVPRESRRTWVGTSSDREVAGEAADLNAAAREVRQLLAQARSPLVLVGNGVHWSRAETLLGEFLGRTKLQCVSTAAARSVLDDASAQWAGVLGSVESNRLVAEADLVLAIGTSFGSTSTGNWQLPIAATLIHVDIDPFELGRHYRPALSVAADASHFLTALIAELGDEDSLVAGPRTTPPARVWPREHKWIDVLSSALPLHCTVVGDVSTTTRWLVRSLRCGPERRLFHPWNHQTLGWSYPAALGVQAAAPHEQVVSVIGDGGMLFSIGELATAVENQLPVCAIVVNNHSYGVIAELQDELYDGRRFGVDLRTPDFAAVARGFDMPAWSVRTTAEFAAALPTALSTNGPTLVEVTAELAAFGD